MNDDLDFEFFLAPQESWGKKHGWFAVAKNGTHDARILRDEYISNTLEMNNIKKSIVLQLYVDTNYNKDFMECWDILNQTNPDSVISLNNVLPDYNQEKYNSLNNTKQTKESNILIGTLDLFEPQKPKKETKRKLKNG